MLLIANMAVHDIHVLNDTKKRNGKKHQNLIGSPQIKQTLPQKKMEGAKGSKRKEGKPERGLLVKMAE